MVCCQVKLPLNFMILMASHLDLTADVCRERDIAIDEAGFEREMEAQRLRAQSANQFGMDYNNVIRVEGETKFEGYTESESLAKVTALFHDGKSVESITAGQSAVVILENTPFYAESGGQIGDSGYLTSQGIQFNVKILKNMVKYLVILVS